MSVNQAVIDSVVKSGELPHAVFVSLLREHVLPRLAPISAADQRQISAAFERERSKGKREKDLIVLHEEIEVSLIDQEPEA